MNAYSASYKVGLLGILLALGGTVAACSSSSDGAAAHSGVASDRPLTQLSEGERAKMCDWAASLHGGYGKTEVIECKDGKQSVTAAPSQSACVKDFDGLSADCKATVADAEACANQSKTCTSELSKECRALLACTEAHPTDGPATGNTGHNPDPHPNPQPQPQPQPSGSVDPSDRLADLSDAQRGTLCDTMNAEMGGYGNSKEVTCGAGNTSTVSAAASREACVADLKKVPSTCAVTVKETQDCLTGMFADPCGPMPAACSAISRCGS